MKIRAVLPSQGRCGVVFTGPLLHGGGEYGVTFNNLPGPEFALLFRPEEEHHYAS